MMMMMNQPTNDLEDTTTTMSKSNNIMDGKRIAQEIRQEIKDQVTQMAQAGGNIPGLAVVLVGHRRDSQTYVNMKKKACAEAGIRSIGYDFQENVTETELLQLIQQLNQDETIHGILIQLPLPNHLPTDRILQSVSPEKDVDGLHPINVAALQLFTHGEVTQAPFSIPCTPLGCLTLLDRYQIPVKGKHCVVLGRSQLVGWPMARLLLSRDATVTICHSQTINPREIVRTADIVICAIGRPQLVPADWIQENAVVIDVGINSIEDDDSTTTMDPENTSNNTTSSSTSTITTKKKKKYKLVGDVDFASVAPKCHWITPVPGGVGPMTIAMLLRNTLHSCQRVNAVKNDVTAER